jgi:phenylalanyl-tRNA synthetase beta chain
MNVSYSWLRSMVPGLEASPEEIAEHLATRGAPVETMESVGAGLEDVVVARVKSVRRHPNADRLSLCEVDNGGEVLQVVCGAPVIAEGGYYPFAGVGVTLPDGFKLKKAKIRGEYSNGMLCSERELGLGRDQAGIMRLSDDSTTGQPLVEVLGLDDVRMDVEVTPNRGDWLSHLGLAREVAPDGVGGVVLPPIPGAPTVDIEVRSDEREVTHGEVSIRVEEPDLCWRFLGVIIRGVTVGPSPEWLTARLRSVGQQSINNVVDATNYVMLEMGNPMHAYDLGRLQESRLVVRKAQDGETMQTLDGLDHEFDSEMLLICDASVPHDIAGTMGGKHSSVTEDTVDVLLECALFDPKSIRSTRRALGISTDASYRFERGVDPEGHLPAVRRALEIILAAAGGEIDGPILEVLPRPWQTSSLVLRTSRVAQVLGVSFGREEIDSLIGPLGFTLGKGTQKETGEEIEVEVPGYRSYDVTREIDLIEEIARTYGYDRFPEELGPFRPTTVPDHPVFQLEDRLRAVLTQEGLLEATNPAFAPESEGNVEINNPISMEEKYLRASLLPDLLRNVEYNLARGSRDVRLFEIGTVFQGGDVGEPPSEDLHVAVAVTGRQHPSHWSEEGASVDFWDLRRILDSALAASGWGEVSVSTEAEGDNLFEPSLSVSVVLADGVRMGSAGRVVSHRIDTPAWAGDLWGLELRLPADPPAETTPTFRPLPQFPGVDRDLALIVPPDVAAAAVIEKIQETGGDLLDDVTIFDLYRGKGVGDGDRSLAFRLRFQAWDRTLTDKQIDRVVGKLLKTLQEDLGVRQRL